MVLGIVMGTMVELRDFAHQVRRQHPSVLQPAGSCGACLDDHRSPLVASRRMDVEAVTAADSIHRSKRETVGRSRAD
jgi:hypothetical protein